jgi:hypothetical protein
MPELKAYTEGYAKGYEEGLREAWEELISLTSKGYTSREIQILAKSQRTTITEKVDRRKRKMMAEIEFAEPIEEAPARGQTPAAMVAPSPQAMIEVRPGGMYLLKEGGLEGALGLMTKTLSANAKGLCILRTHPDNVRNRFPLDHQMVWLTKTESCQVEEASGKCEFVSPTDLPRLNTMIKSFLTENKGGTVLLEGMEYLITQNEFKNVLKFLQVIRDQVILAKGIMLIPLDPGVLEERDLKALEREMG